MKKLAAIAAVAAIVASMMLMAPPTKAASEYILLPQATLMSLPTTGAAWSGVTTWAAKSASSPDLSDQDDPDNVTVLAKALVAARTGNTTYRDQVVTALRAIPGTETSGACTTGCRTLSLGRELAAYILSADLIGYRDPAFASFVSSIRTKTGFSEGTSLVYTAEHRPNNWGTHAGASRVAADIYLGDTADLDRQWTVFKGWLGDRSSYAGFSYGDLSWQADPTKPVGINPQGAVKSGVNIDGVLPDDMRRGAKFPTVGSSGVSYSWEALQGALLEGYLFHRAGYPALTASDSALGRAVAWLYGRGFPPTGDDSWQAPMANAMFGTNRSYTAPTSPGKNFGFADWLFSAGTPGPSATLSPAPSPAITPSPTPVVTPSPTPTPTPVPTATPTPVPTPTPTPVPTPTPTPVPTPSCAVSSVVDAINADASLSAADKNRLIDLYNRLLR